MGNILIIAGFAGLAVTAIAIPAGNTAGKGQVGGGAYGTGMRSDIGQV